MGGVGEGAMSDVALEGLELEGIEGFGGEGGVASVGVKGFDGDEAELKRQTDTHKWPSASPPLGRLAVPGSCLFASLKGCSTTQPIPKTHTLTYWQLTCCLPLENEVKLAKRQRCLHTVGEQTER